MARSFILSALRTRARRRADQESTLFVSDAEANQYISASYAELYDILVKSGLSYFETDATVNATGASVYALPADHYATLAVHYQVQASPARYVPLALLQPAYRHAAEYSGASRAYVYRVVGTNLELLPAPATGGVYRHTYVPAPADLTADGNSVDGVSGWEEFIVVDAAIKMRTKEESDTAALERDRARLLERIAEAAENRNMGQPHKVIDARDAYDAFMGEYGWWYQPWARGGDDW